MAALTYSLAQVGPTDGPFVLYVFTELAAPNPGAAFASPTVLRTGATYDQVWSQGILVLFDAPLSKPADAFAAAALLTAADLTTGIAWIANAAQLGGGAPAATVAASLSFQSGVQAVAGLTFLPLGNCSIGVAANTPVQFGAAALAFSNLSVHAPTLFLATSAGRRFATVGPSVAADNYNLANSGIELSLAADTFGCWQFTLTLEKDTGRNLQSDIELLDAGLHYYVGGSAPATLYYPVFDTDADSLSLSVTGDTLQPTNATRSILCLPDAALPSYLRTPAGNPVTLTPLPGAGLVFTATASGYTVTPTGSFTIGCGTAARLLCGLSGTEYLAPVDGAALSFLPGQNAYVDDPTLPTAALTGTETTAWVGIMPAASVDYVDQSPATVFYQLGLPQTAWNVLEPVVATLPVLSGAEQPQYFPLVPYAGVRQRTNTAAILGTGGLDPGFYATYQTYEALLYRTRAEIVQMAYPVVPPADDKGSVYGVTPQGMLIRFDPALIVWKDLILAQGENAGSGVAGSLYFQEISGGFKRALRGAQLFVVMDNTVNGLADPGFTAPAALPVEFAGWTFDFAPGGWAKHGTIAIIKSHRQSLSALVNDSNAWSWPAAADLSGDAADTQARLQAIFADVATQAAINPNYSYLNQVIGDPDWQGILYFNVPMDLATIPPDLAMLSAGIDPKKFFAHHVGINITSVQGLDSVTGLPVVAPSSAFGLIKYSDTSILSTPAPYAYKVSTLQSLFLNSLTVNVDATVQLVVNVLFGHDATLQGGQQGNVIQLAGSAQSHDGHMSLMLTSDQTQTFTLDNSVIAAVEVDTVQFFGLNTPDTSNPKADPTVRTRFLFSGALRFVDLTNGTAAAAAGFKTEMFDFFSFHRLAYQQLRLDMQYLFDHPRLASFTFDPDHISFVLNQSTSRQQSLADQLTLRARSFASSLQGTTPEALNFIPLVVTPFSNTSGANGTWYGLGCELPLGSMGALAPNLMLSLEVLLAWCPAPGGGTPDELWFGVRLPGANSAGVFFNIEDVVKMGIKQVVLEAVAGAPVMTFQNIGLTVLGQTLPPGGQTDVTLAGDASGKARALAWFASYLKNSV